jgi:hypothetical protein
VGGAGVTGAPVVNEHGRYLGAADIEGFAALAEEGGDKAVAGRGADVTSVTVATTATLDVGCRRIAHGSRSPW